MIPDAVLHKYTELLAQQPVNPTELALLVSLDAQLLSRWCRLLNCDASPGALLDAITQLDSSVVPSLGLAIAIAVMPQGEAPRMSLDDWGGRLANAVLGELLASGRPGIDSGSVRLQCLLGLAELSAGSDPLAQEMIEFRGEAAEYLVDAHPLVQIFSVVESYHAGDEAAAIDSADELLRVSRAEFADALAAAAERTDALMGETDLVDESVGDWLASLWHQLQIATFSSVLARASNTNELIEAHRLSTRTLFGREPLILALVDAPERPLIGLLNGPTENSVASVRTDALTETSGSQHLRVLNRAELRTLSIDTASATSRIAACVREGDPLEINDRASTVVVERQLLRRLGTKSAIVYPLVSDSQTVGACVFPLNTGASGHVDDTEDQELPRRAYTAALGDWVALHGVADAPEDDNRALTDYAGRVERRLREIVHEANNPLSVVRNYLHILDMKLAGNAEAQEQIELISSEVRRAADVIRQAVDVSRDVDATPAVDTLEFDLNELVRGVCELQGQAARLTGIDVVPDVTSSEISVQSDRDRVTQVLINLVKNAVEALASGDQVIVSTATGIYRAGREGVEIKVRDTGPGLPSDVLRVLFEPKTTSKGGRHEGLGLHLVKRLVDELRGEIDVRTAPGEGAEFAVFLPLVDGD